MRQKKIQEAASMRAQSEKIMVPLVSMKSKIPTLPEEKRDMIEKLPNNAESLAATAESLDQEIEGDKTLMEERANSTVRVRKTLFAEVRVDIRGDRHRFTQVFGGPLLIERVGTRIRAKSQG
jgi:tRNA/tmRNA/rRNA uracil-C5-methylase (TrmA/RlmC/RlmD family)